MKTCLKDPKDSPGKFSPRRWAPKAAHVILGGAVRAFAITYLWKWFVVPLGLPPIGIAHAYGLSLCLMVMTPHAWMMGIEGGNKGGDNAWEEIVLNILMWLLMLGLGAIVFTLVTE